MRGSPNRLRAWQWATNPKLSLLQCKAPGYPTGSLPEPALSPAGSSRQCSYSISCLSAETPSSDAWFEILPSFKNKRQAVDISQQIERDVSAYLFTITIMNLAVGVATGAVMALCRLGDPLLWGTLAFLLNYIPILGPLMGVSVFLLAGLLSIQTLWAAFLPAALYLVTHLIEGETVTPMLLARRFTINPVLVVLPLVFWYWMWGGQGRFLRRRCSRSPKSFATASGRLWRSAISSKAK